MATRADRAPDVAGAADRLIAACADAVCIRIEADPPIDALAAGVRAIAGIYDRAAPAPRRNSRRK